ncbi:hypothetical protein BGZ80_004096, partial [Entomortierella chlamydospora]
MFGLVLGFMALTLLSFGTGADVAGGTSAGLYVDLFLILAILATLAYAMAIFHLKHRWMIELRMDAKFYDRMGPM